MPDWSIRPDAYELNADDGVPIVMRVSEDAAVVPFITVLPSVVNRAAVTPPGAISIG
jgi:hypothetical protein